jgi:hypothetical protein
LRVNPASKQSERNRNKRRRNMKKRRRNTKKKEET